MYAQDDSEFGTKIRWLLIVLLLAVEERRYYL